jgi:amino acid adenylation domain-containing protein
MVVATLAALKAGSAYLPLDTSYPEERLAFMLEDAQAPVLITRERWLGLFPVEAVWPVCLDRDAALLARRSSLAPPFYATPESLAYVIYTSGSTGRPKGVAVPHRAVVRLVRNTSYIGIRPDDVIAQASNTSFDAATFEIWGALLNGARMVGVAKETMLSPRDLAAQIRRDGVTVLFLTTALFNQVIRELPDAFTPLRHLLFGGEPVDPAAVRRCLLSGAPERLLHVYGPTESTTFASWHLVGEVPAGATTVPIGQPVANTTLVVLDPERNLVPVGVTGELCVGGDGLAWGYLNQPELTAERFVPDTDGMRLYRTGDLVRRRADGAIEFLGRADFQVKVRGFRIELGEIEAALISLPGVRDAAVLALGEGGDKRLVAYVAGTRDGGLREHLADRLPSFMVPTGWVFLDALPLNPNGKVDRRALARIEPEADETPGGYVAPRTPAEELLAMIWSELLGVPPAGARDDFFALGGHSLLATRLTSRVRDLFGVELPLRTVFEDSTLAGLAAWIDARRGTGLQAAPPVQPREPGSEVPLSFAQERLWFLDRMEPGGALYSVPLALRVRGALQAGALETALAGVVRRHEALRTTFTAGPDGSPRQSIAAGLAIPLPVADLAGLPPEEREAEALRRFRAEAVRPFDLQAGPLLRAFLLRLGEEEHWVLLVLHHIVSDGWSLGVLVREIGELYDAHTHGRPALLPELPVQYGDYALWQRRWLSGEVEEAQVAFWKEALAGAPTVLELPTDRPRPPIQTFRGASRIVALPASLAADLQDLGRREGATLFMTLLAGFQALLHRYAGQDDILVGSPIANRQRGELEGLIGLFVNALVLRGRLDPATEGGPSFGELLARVRSFALDAYAHQDLPFERLVEELRIERSLARTPLHQVVFSLQNTPVEPLSLPGLILEPLGVGSGTAKTDLLLSLGEGADGLLGTWEYSTDLFDASTIDRLTVHLRTLLESAAADPGARVGDLALLPPAERHQLLAEWNDTGRDASPDICLHELFEAQAARRPEAVAVRFQGRSLTYGDLDLRANRLARHLAGLGVGPASLVGICAEEGFERLIGVLAVFKAGSAYLPLDPSHPEERLAWTIQDAGVGVILTQERLLTILPESEAEIVCLDTLESLDNVRPIPQGVRSGLAYVIYTSGSTGRPNGVTTTHQAAVHLLRQAVEQFRVNEDSRILQSVSFSFDASVLETWMAFSTGATLCVANHEVRLSGERLAGLIRSEGITTAVLTPVVLASLPTDGVPTLRVVSVGGDACPAETVNRWMRSGLDRLLNCYGPTETTIYASTHLCSGTYRTVPPIGRPLARTWMHVVDPRGVPVPLGVPGELLIGGDGLSMGYLNRPSLTASRFVPDPFGEEAGARLYRSGDLVRRLPDGELEFLGRVDRQIKLRGLRIELGEIESALGRHPAVRDCAVVVHETSGDPRLVACVVPNGIEKTDPGQEISSQLRAYLREGLPDYMVPSSFLFLESFPLSPTGKVDRKALARLEPDAGVELPRVEPRDLLELELVGIWQEVLGVLGGGRLGVRDDFFESGGHSLLAVRLMARIKERFGRELPLAVLFQGGTVEAMAALLRRERAEDTGTPSCLVPIQSSGPGLPFFCVHPAGGDVLCFSALARHLGSGQPFYGLRSRGMAEGEAPLDRIEDMAALYVEELRRVQPAGPYRIGGWSLGGLIAFEMARQLRQPGRPGIPPEDVDLLILDSSPRIAGAEEPSRLDILLDVVHYVETLWNRPLGLTADDLEPLDPEARLDLLVERLRGADLLPPGAGEASIRRIVEVYAANTRAVRGYVPGRYAGRVTLFQAGEQPNDLGWSEISDGPVEIHTVPATHLTMLAEPAVKRLAQQIRARLEDVQSASVLEPRGEKP